MTFEISVSKMIGGFMNSAYTDQFEQNYIDAITTPHPTNLAKFFQAIRDGHWSATEQDLASIRSQLHVPIMSGGSLDRWAKVLDLPRKVGESDAEYRIRIAGVIQRRYGRVTPDAIIEFVSSLIGAEPEDIIIRENNRPVGNAIPANYNYLGGQFTVQFDLEILSTLGFAPEDFPAVIETIDALLVQASAAGVQGFIDTSGGAVWDTDTYDDPEDLWGT